MKGIAALDRVAWKRNRKSGYIPDGEHVWRVWIDNAHVIVIEDADSIVGCALAFTCLDDSLCLHKIFVEENAQGKGFGKKLLSEMLRIARGESRDIWLTVDPVNNRAINLYKSMGLEVKTYDDHYYGDEEPRYIMIKKHS